MAAEHWFRWHHGSVTDPKWRVIASRCVTSVTVGHVVTVWAAMLENASQASPRGSLCGWDDEDIAVLFGYEIEQVSAIRDAMQGKVLDGDKLISWGKRQPNREDNSTARTREYRDRQRNAHSEGVTQCDAAQRAVTLETETETEKKKRKKALDHRADDRKRTGSFFDTRFWPAYPRKVAKASAAKAFAKIKPDEAELGRMLAALAVQKQSAEWQREGGQYIPHPATWLNGRRWEDEAPAAAVADINGRQVL